jgi:hypothetical protein
MENMEKKKKTTLDNQTENSSKFYFRTEMDDNSNYIIFLLRKTNLTPQFFIQVSVPKYESERSYICALDSEIGWVKLVLRSRNMM